ncbi:hypothetical protein DW352_18725 [Pseudolabrys taiwanensis]|uniref:Uncharacterized protein n=1 Tax=Pseudolabrys taiwanensis TaxID=331696 RepID=A0A345ZZM2_9HYPH|nr:hypothetical protein [Pseudolabrys taiwanensis]AXK82369.1 hypothetical protein DW352_18725 [Pseudolabrys taiwanensis]
MKVFVGTAQEYKEVAHLFGDESAAKPDAASSQIPAKTAKGESEAAALSSEIIEYAFSRIPLSQNQSKVWRTIVDAYPNWVNVIELADRTGLSRQEIAGVWGALGRRLAHTTGWPTDEWPMDEDRDHNNLRRYRAHADLVRLVKAGRIKLK